MKLTTPLRRWMRGAAMTGQRGSRARRSTHGPALARLTRAACALVLFTAVGALWSVAAPAQQAQQTREAPQAQATQQLQNAAPPATPSRPFAAPSVTTSPAPTGIASLGQVTLALGLVLALIFVAAWLMRRLRGFGKTGTGTLEIIADLPVGQKERAVLIRVGARQVLIGVAPGRVTTLHVLDEPVNVTPPSGGISSTSGTSMERPNFKSLLMKSLGK